MLSLCLLLSTRKNEVIKTREGRTIQVDNSGAEVEGLVFELEERLGIGEDAEIVDVAVGRFEGTFVPYSAGMYCQLSVVSGMKMLCPPPIA